jgi:hypothetical protein
MKLVGPERVGFRIACDAPKILTDPTCCDCKPEAVPLEPPVSIRAHADKVLVFMYYIFIL